MERHMAPLLLLRGVLWWSFEGRDVHGFNLSHSFHLSVSGKGLQALSPGARSWLWCFSAELGGETDYFCIVLTVSEREDAPITARERF
ncbi:hypothetical protein INR49_013079 [Caranx melampygus]|nr:hypothetical protein INR49_013079 [Caranx melampygus]